MQRIVCPDTESWTMVERLISDDVERLGNVQWWSLVSQCISDQSVRAMHCGAETRGCCAVSVDCENVGAREMGSRVQCTVYWNSLAVEAGSTESGGTCGT